MASRHCRNEIQYALAHNKAVVSVYLRPTNLPAGHTGGYQPFMHDALSLNLSLAFHELGQEDAAREASLASRRVSAETLREAWERDGWRGYNLTLAAAFEGLLSRHRELLARAGEGERTYACLDELMANTTGPYQTRVELNNRRSLAGQFRAGRAYAPYRAESRFQQLVGRLRVRMDEAAGTYALPSSIR